MTKFSLPYGRGEWTLNLPDSRSVELIQPRQALATQDPVQVVADALANPLDGLTLERFKGARSVAIAVNDKTRPAPHHVILPPLLDRLRDIGIADENILLLTATGTHAPMTTDEIRRLLPEAIVNRYAVCSHDCDNEQQLVDVGITSRGTPVFVNRAFYSADLRIVTGDIEPHHFAGFSGGVKPAAIGLAGRRTINANHRWLTDPHAAIGVYEQNPVRQDIEEIGARMGVHYALNAILNGEHQVLHALAGQPLRVMAEGIPMVRRAAETPVKHLFDLVIASAGGHPKDINLYQAQKALTSASMITRPQGTIMLAAACPEGSGSYSYEAFMHGMTDHQQVLEKFHATGFQVGPHKALQIAREALQKRMIIVSEMDPSLTERLLLAGAPDLQAAVDRVLAELPPDARIAIMPHATTTLPTFIRE